MKVSIINEKVRLLLNFESIMNARHQNYNNWPWVWMNHPASMNKRLNWKLSKFSSKYSHNKEDKILLCTHTHAVSAFKNLSINIRIHCCVDLMVGMSGLKIIIIIILIFNVIYQKAQ